ncbi:L,D-transpeptidase [Aureimonas psammosilenae]|uniref:L,D-transpeptidase n=1 Tax=Aureimonas psammosilenae TaxID=2495496 RepID=UPI001F329394|nr:L,D-transpeptidase [Aureimonas psammosilenae]
MSNRSALLRFSLSAALSVSALLTAAAPGSAQDRGVVLSRQQERQALAQLAPGSGVRTATARRAYPGYAEAQPGVRPGYAEMPAQKRTMGGLFGYLANRQGRAVVVEEGAPAARPRAQAVRTATVMPRAAKIAPRTAAFDPAFLPQEVSYSGGERPGTVVIDTNAKFLYLVGEGGTARRYGVGVGKPGFEWAGRHRVTRKSEWPTWTPPSQMRERERQKGRILPIQMAGGPENPLGARAMYLGSTLYRIHGTNQPWSIGKAVSSGCIRMRNEDVTDLYERVAVGTNVIVL